MHGVILSHPMCPNFLAYSEAQGPGSDRDRACPLTGPHLIKQSVMETKENIYRQTKSLIPSDLWTRYNKLSYGEMAKVSELTAWATQLREADRRATEAGG